MVEGDKLEVSGEGKKREGDGGEGAGRKSKKQEFGRNGATLFAQGGFARGAFTPFIGTTKTQHEKKVSSVKAAPPAWRGQINQGGEISRSFPFPYTLLAEPGRLGARRPHQSTAALL